MSDRAVSARLRGSRTDEHTQQRQQRHFGRSDSGGRKCMRSQRLIVTLKRRHAHNKTMTDMKVFEAEQRCEQTQVEAAGSIISLHLSHAELSSAWNLLCRVTSFVSCVTFLTAHCKQRNYLGLAGSPSCLRSDESGRRMASSRSVLPEDQTQTAAVYSFIFSKCYFRFYIFTLFLSKLFICLYYLSNN